MQCEVLDKVVSVNLSTLPGFDDCQNERRINYTILVTYLTVPTNQQSTAQH